MRDFIGFFKMGGGAKKLGVREEKPCLCVMVHLGLSPYFCILLLCVLLGLGTFFIY